MTQKFQVTKAKFVELTTSCIFTHSLPKQVKYARQNIKYFTNGVKFN